MHIAAANRPTPGFDAICLRDAHSLDQDRRRHLVVVLTAACDEVTRGDVVLVGNFAMVSARIKYGLAAVGVVVASSVSLTAGAAGHRLDRAVPHALARASSELPTIAARRAAGLRTAGTFVSLVPACACGRRTALDQFSLRDGRRLGTLATIARLNPPTFALSDPEPAGGRSFDLTISRGPLCRAPAGGGISFGPCIPDPNTCTSVVDRVNFRTGTVSTVLSEPVSATVTDTVPSPDGRRLALLGGSCSASGRYLTVRDARWGRHWTIGADVQRCTGIGPPRWSPDGRRIIFRYAPAAHPPPANADFCPQDRFSGLVITSANRPSISPQWSVIHADRRCGFLYGTFDRRGIAAVEGCTFGQPAGQPGAYQLGDSFLLQLSGPQHRVTERIPLKLGFDGGTMATDPRSGSVLISEYQAANNGTHPYSWVWAFSAGHLRLVKRYPENDALAVSAEPW